MVGQSDTVLQGHLGAPTLRRCGRHVQQLSGSAVGLGRIKNNCALELNHPHDKLSELSDGDVNPRADVEERTVVARLHKVDARMGQVVDVQELAHGPATTPDDELLVATQLGLVSLANERGEHVAVLEVVVVPRAVQVGGHNARVARGVLPVEALAKLDARNLGQRVGLVGLLQGAREQVLLPDGLGAVARVDAARPEEHEVLNARSVGALNEVGLHHEVLVDKVRTVDVVGLYAPHLGRGNKNVVGLLGI